MRVAMAVANSGAPYGQLDTVSEERRVKGAERKIVYRAEVGSGCGNPKEQWAD